MLTLFDIVLFITALLLALIAGLFYSYSCSVNLGLGRLSDIEYLRAMQSINRAILNPCFFASFFGTLLMMPLSTWLSYMMDSPNPSFYLILAATGIYIIGVFVVTIFGNVPLNESLNTFDLENATPELIKSKRLEFEAPWNRLNLIRTVANVLSLALILWAIMKD